MKSGGRFTAYDDYIEGHTLYVEPNKRVVQSWRASDWAEGIYSLVVFEFKARGKNETVLTFSHIGVPVEEYSQLKQGWVDHYWIRMKDYLKS